jgi:hypothetical protein
MNCFCNLAVRSTRPAMKKIALNLTILLLAHFLSVGQPVLFNTGSSVQAFIKDPLCCPDDGSLNLSINGQYSPYKTSLNGSNASDDLAYPGLAGGSYHLSTTDKDGCIWDTTLTVRLFNKDIVSI